MQCIDTRDLLSAYIDDVLGPRERFEVEKHLAACSACRQELDELKETVRLLKSLGELAPPASFRQDLMARISEKPVTPMVVLPSSNKASSPDKRKLLQLFKRYRTIAAAAVIFGIGICIGVYQLTFDPRGGGLDIAGQTDMYSGNSPSNRELTQSADQNRARKTPKASESSSGEIALADKQIGGQVNTTPGFKASPETDKITATPKSSSVGRGIKQRAAKTASPAAGLLAQTSKKSEANDPSVKEPETGGPEMGITSESVGAGGTDNQQKAKGSGLKDKAQKIVKTADIQMTVENYKAFISRLRTATEQHLGYIENSTEDLVGTTSANFVIRVPVDNFSGLMSKIEEMGTVTATSVSGSDVSGEYVDTEARIHSLSVQEQRLLTLINRAGSLGDVVSLESELSRVRSEIETLQGRINSLDSMVAYSTIRLRVSETEKVSMTAPKGVVGKTMDNVKRSSVAMVNMFGNIVAFTGWVAPWAALVGGAGGTVVCIGKAAGRSKEDEIDKNL